MSSVDMTPKTPSKAIWKLVAIGIACFIAGFLIDHHQTMFKFYCFQDYGFDFRNGERKSVAFTNCQLILP